MKIFLSFIFLFATCVFSYPARADWPATIGQYQCLEVEVFQVDRDKASNRKEKRTAKSPEEGLLRLQQKIVSAIQEEKIISEVNQAGRPSCSGKALVVGGMISDYNIGSAARTFLIGGFAGKTKIVAETYIKDKQTGQILVKRRIAESSPPAIGNSEPPVEKQFASNVGRFVRKGK